MSQETQQLDREQFNKTVANNTLVTIASTLVYLVTRTLVPPIVLAFVGMEIWGIWSFAFVIIGFLGLGSFGINNVYIRLTAVFYAKGDVDGISRLISTGLGLTVPFGAALLLAGWYGMPWLIGHFGISEANQDIAFVLFFSTSALFMIQFTLGAFACVLTGMQLIREVKLLDIVAAMLETGLIVALLFADFGVYALPIAYGVRYVLTGLLLVGLTFRRLPGLRVGFSLFDRSHLHHFYNFGGLMQLNGVLSMITSTLDRVIFLRLFGEKAAGFLDIGQKFPRMAVFIPDGISHAIYPAVTQLQQGAHHDEIEKLYIRSCRYISLIMAPLMGFMAPFAAPTILCWLGPEAETATPAFLMALFTLPFQFHVFTGPASAVFKGLGQALKETRYPVLKLIGIVLGLAIVWARFPMDMTHVSVAVALGILFSTMAYVFWSNVTLKIHHGRFFTRAVLPGFLPYFLGYALFFATESWLMAAADDRWALILRMIPTGMVFVIMTAIMFYVLVLDGDERDHLKKYIPARLRR